MKQKCVLVITDGIGYKPKNPYNAFDAAFKPNYERLFKEVPFGMIKTYGEFVGLPDGQMGNSEVGHMSLGSGRILYQDLVKINQAIKNQSLQKHPIIQDFFSCNVVHLLALLSDGGVHSHIEHLLALIRIFHAQNKEVRIHALTDGRDVPPQTAEKFLRKLLDEIAIMPKVILASVGGRFYGMDRDKRFERVNEAYEVIALGKNLQSISPLEYIANQLKEGISDEFVQPACFHQYSGFGENEGLLCVNFRSDRMREIVTFLGEAQLSDFSRRDYRPLGLLATMTCYDERFPYPVLFPKEKVKNTIAEILSMASLKQLHTAETEKYAHVTFFFNGGKEEAFKGEERILIPSPNVKTYDLQPEMSAREVAEVVLQGMKDGFDFIVVNFANGDMVGHTGNFEAAIKAVEAVDKEIGRIFELAQELNYGIVLTSDHGNCEEMADYSGKPLTNHTVGEVWCFIYAEGVNCVNDGSLANIAPSVLKVMGMQIPCEMEKPLF
ncbi:phosphoglycerate mutase (2,3-diphosphoglycerate-independent) [Helicobacter monodelphidis]|uniref:2,3-bisphosphoglycerate-independent phosphoglycerate mutase n=1 Tax=Helicobacter sp. 15-1451 TaxID=2004995 RepID=UPI000DCAFD39|nr:2,3-bisphosphoglycerate-independent phosphoglycerate mutase [Helicobacter sp. 15-1451]RAX57990.1 phosphoglycerate mutase (2,3-diphosphoglycerate-independent) [Helicobacter sp. 15-1451]